MKKYRRFQWPMKLRLQHHAASSVGLVLAGLVASACGPNEVAPKSSTSEHAEPSLPKNPVEVALLNVAQRKLNDEMGTVEFSQEVASSASGNVVVCGRFRSSTHGRGVYVSSPENVEIFSAGKWAESKWDYMCANGWPVGAGRLQH